MTRTFHSLLLIALLAFLLATMVRAQESHRHEASAPAPVVRVGTPEKVCQLTGDVDWETGKPTAARTFTNFGLDAVDLGYPVEHDRHLIFLFGDSWPPPHGGGPMSEVIPDDAVGVSTRTESPDPRTCLDLIVYSRREGSKKVFEPNTITGPVKVKQGFFNVPSGGVSVGSALYAFFWTDHCSAPVALAPAPQHPLQKPAPSAGCPETEGRSSIGRGVMARSDDMGHTFHQVVQLPPGFVYTVAVDATLFPELSEEQRLGVFIFGVPRYRASVPYLAYAPQKTFADPATWRFFAGMMPDGRPKWLPLAEWKPRPEGQIYTPAAMPGYNVGEFSVTWNRPLHVWLMMYGGVAVRVARHPWGPWSDATPILGPADLAGCKLVMAATGCGDRRDYWTQKHHGNQFQPGGFYAPFVMNLYTRAGERPHSAVLYWVLSTWNPYQVTVMRTTIAMPDERPEN